MCFRGYFSFWRGAGLAGFVVKTRGQRPATSCIRTARLGSLSSLFFLSVSLRPVFFVLMFSIRAALAFIVPRIHGSGLALFSFYLFLYLCLFFFPLGSQFQVSILCWVMFLSPPNKPVVVTYFWNLGMDGIMFSRVDCIVLN